MIFNFRFLQKIFVLGVCVTLSTSFVSGHSGESHGARHVEEEATSEEQIKLASDLYQKMAEPIFKKSCLDCHGTPAAMPWYYRFPIVKGMIEGDMKEAKEHLDMSAGFPFGGHGNNFEDLEAVSETIAKKDMPPRSYRLLHPSSALTKDEESTILEWIQKTREILKKEEGHH